MTKKIFLGIILVSLVIMLASTGLVMGIMYDYMGDKIDGELANEAFLVSEGMEAGGSDYLQSLYKSSDVGNRITLVDVNGNVIFDNMADASKMENHKDREEIKEALSEGIGHSVRTSSTLSKETRYYAVKLDDGSILRISTTHYSQLGLVLDTIGIVIVFGAILLALGALISHNVTKAIIKPINSIDLDNPDIDETYEELAPLLHRIRQQNVRISKQMDNLRKSREEFSVITGNMSEGLIIVDQSAEILTYNKSAVSLLGETDGLKVTGSVFKLNRSEDFRNAVYGALRGNNIQNIIEINNVTCEIIASPVTDDGKVTGAVIIIIDITAKAQGERMRREFTSNVSHELKTPLTSIYGVSDMLSSGMVKSEDVSRFAGTIREESSRLITLIEDIIKLSQLDENTVPDNKEPVDLFGVAENVVTRLGSKAKGAGVAMTLSGQHVNVLGVEYILDEIVYNLCENAIKYNKEGGSVIVSVEGEDGECVLQVKDTGIGIPKEDMDRVFERFYRVDKSHSKKIGGTGLGLSIVKHAAAYMDGTIELSSNLGVGTTISIRFKAV